MSRQEKLTITKIQNGCNCYLVEKNGASLLIDPGLNGKSKKIIELCKSKNTKKILLTHGHKDHIECVSAIQKALQIPVIMHTEDKPLIENNLSQPMNGRGLFGTVFAFFSRLSVHGPKIESFPVTDPLDSGSFQSAGAFRIIPHFVPGHTKGSIAYQIDDQLFVGDALMNVRKPEISLLYSDLPALYESEKKLSTLQDIDQIYFGHGKPVSFRKYFS